MAQVDELMVVLDADPTGLEDGLKSAGNATEDFTQQQQANSLAAMENLARQEAMVGSLNQVTGGYGKAVGAAQKLGLVNEEQFAALEKSRAAMELIAGPLEVFIALKKFAAESGVSMRENILENLSEDQKMQRESDANIVISDMDILNEAINNANAIKTSRTTLDLPNVAGDSESLDKIPARVEAFKRQHVDILSKLIDQDIFWAGEGSADDHPLQLLKNATSLSDKYRHLQTLANTYIGSDGTKLLPNKVSEMWNNDEEQIDIFYNLLQSFNSLLVLNPLPAYGKKDIGK